VTPAVSVIVPAYKAAHVVGRAVDGLLAQTWPPDEILIVDDGSPDDLAGALAPYGGRVRLLRKANGGAAGARNFGLGRAAGDVIAFLDADDYWEPEKLKRQLGLLARFPEVGLASAWFFTREPGRPREP
jgi:glycosyltransferase involved in cell wall biosynthesis